jgi:hypothetical protein
VQGSYPTLIVILVCIQKSPVDHYSATYSTGMQFAKAPSVGSNRLGHVMPRQVYAIRREYVNDSETQPSGMFASTLDDEKGI